MNFLLLPVLSTAILQMLWLGRWTNLLLCSLSPIVLLSLRSAIVARSDHIVRLGLERRLRFYHKIKAHLCPTT
jgi:hypothetical protein